MEADCKLGLCYIFRTVDDLKVCTTKNMSYSIVERGSPNTLEYRVYFCKEDDKTRGSVSLKHDGPTGQTTGLADFYSAMLCIRGTSHGPVSVCLSVCLCLSQVGVLLKRLNVGSHKQHHTIAQGL